MFVGNFHGNSGLGNDALTVTGTVGYNSLVPQMHAFVTPLRAVTALIYTSMKRIFPIALFVAALLFAPVRSFAHHSFAAEFDGTKPVTLKGKVTEFEWVNPHSWVHVDVTDENGNTVNWACETASPN